MKRNNIVLVGMMGAGKSTVAKSLFNLLNDYSIQDVDSLIEQKMGLSISEIFDKYGEQEFRKIESEVIEETCQKNKTIISTGGGAFENPINRKVLLNSGKVFYLYAPSQVLYDRIKTQGDRPLLQCENPELVFINLLDKRDKNYRKADYIIDTTLLSPEQVAREVLRRGNETFVIS